ncbi:MAG TPA: hypothetical protein VMF30_13905 [Pirellulales bacterium]|nr:hypothetical protein [Pirellulales bacterium]
MSRQPTKSRCAALGLLALAAIAQLSWTIADGEDRPAAAPPAAAGEPKPSQYAPAADLIDQAEYYIGRIGEALTDEKEFNEDLQKRTANDANTLAVIALVLAKHDEANKLQAAPFLPATRRLAEVADKFGPATAALAEVKKAAEAGGAPAADVAWEPVAPLDSLMRQVPIVNNSLRRGLDPNRFKRQQKQAAGQAATLAAIAQAAQFDLSDADDASAADWRALCREMRDAAGGVNSAVHAGDPSGAQAGAKRLAQNCDACHEKFRGGK